MLSRTFSALGTDIVIGASLDPWHSCLLSDAETLIRDFETRASRFLPTSEISIMNNGGAGEYHVSDSVRDVLLAAKYWHVETGGVFDSTIHDALLAAGYVANFSDLPSMEQYSSDDVQALHDAFAKRPTIQTLDIVGNTVRKPEGLRLDLGGIGKGWIVDHVYQKLFQEVPNVLVSAGGDLLVKGNEDGLSGWRISVQDPHNPSSDRYVLQTRGEVMAVATSGIIKRRGGSGTTTWHHIIDPRTGVPVENTILSVTAMSTTVERADVYAKTILILGVEQGLEFIQKQYDSACIIFPKEGEPIFSRKDFIAVQ